MISSPSLGTDPPPNPADTMAPTPSAGLAATTIDGALELLVVPSFTRVGYEARRRLFAWPDDAAHDLTGRVIAVTGATSGLGLAAVGQLAGRGATVIVIGRDRAKTEAVADTLRDRHGDHAATAVVADLGDLDQVRAGAERIMGDHERLDAIIHNAGALTHHRTTSRSGIESTLASQVVGPFLLTALLLDRLAQSPPGRVITVSSGGMYAANLAAGPEELDPPGYQGTQQYARAKRAQVTLNQMWAERVDRRSVVFHAMHPGWADTPGVAASLPTFRRIVGPLLRDPTSGADTMVWLASDDGAPLASTGGFWLDRRPRPIHRLPTTRRSDTPDRRQQLWAWVATQALGDPEYQP